MAEQGVEVVLGIAVGMDLRRLSRSGISKHQVIVGAQDALFAIKTEFRREGFESSALGGSGSVDESTPWAGKYRGVGHLVEAAEEHHRRADRGIN